MPYNGPEAYRRAVQRIEPLPKNATQLAPKYEELKSRLKRGLELDWLLVEAPLYEALGLESSFEKVRETDRRCEGMLMIWECQWTQQVRC